MNGLKPSYIALSYCLVLAAVPGSFADQTTQSTVQPEEHLMPELAVPQTPEQLQRLVAPIALPTLLYIGAENWPFPIPLTLKNGKWSFDPEMGKHEMVFRRIGENEGAAIEVCHALIAAGTTPGTSGGTFYGYYFHALTEPATTTAGTSGPTRGVSKAGRLAYIAYPVEYRESGVMTFVVTPDGMVYQKDLGPKTASLAMEIHARTPRTGWHVVR